jgi:hypothetical protein
MATAAAAATERAAGLLPRDRAQLESEIRALRAQVIALGGIPDDRESCLSEESDADNHNLQNCEIGDLDWLPHVDDGGLLADTPADAQGHLAVADLGSDIHVDELNDLELLSDAMANTGCMCPYCKECLSSPGIGGNRSKVPRKENSIGMWCAAIYTRVPLYHSLACINSRYPYTTCRCLQELKIRLQWASLLS